MSVIWHVMTCYDITDTHWHVRHIMTCMTLWHVMTYYDMLWHVMTCYDILWHVKRVMKYIYVCICRYSYYYNTNCVMILSVQQMSFCFSPSISALNREKIISTHHLQTKYLVGVMWRRFFGLYGPQCLVGSGVTVWKFGIMRIRLELWERGLELWHWGWGWRLQLRMRIRVMRMPDSQKISPETHTVSVSDLWSIYNLTFSM